MTPSDHRYEKPTVVPVGPFAHPVSESPDDRDGPGGDEAPGIAPDPPTPDHPGPSTTPDDTDGEPEPDAGPATAGEATTI